MSFERQNILDLIGGNKGKYSSCIITCFSFDFMFFEERVMPVLRYANIKNVNVFLDGKYLESALEESTGEEFQRNRTYSLNPIYEKGVFHPKIMLLTGPKHGLLVIGSGNLTSSGLSTNDEIWGAFHLNSLESINAPLFADAWRYLQFYFEQVKGFNIEKLAWVYQRSAWLNDLKNFIPKEYIKIEDQQEVRFIANKSNISIYKELLQWLPKSKISNVRIVSPFYDSEGKFMEQLLNDFTIAAMECITDSEFGLLPSKMSGDLSNKIKFYDWKDCLSDFDVRFNRLHAKIFQFEYEDGWEYLLIGSPNATLSAFGSASKKAINGEAGLLLRRRLNNGYISDLGISTDNATPFDVRLAERNVNNTRDDIQAIKYKNRIVYAELNGPKTTVYFKKAVDADCQLVTIDTENKAMESLPIAEGIIEAKIELNQISGLFAVFLKRDGKRISNYALIHNVAILAKCNPDPNQEELYQIIELLSDNPEKDHFIELLRHADYNWVDEELDGYGKTSNFSNSNNKLHHEKEKIYEDLNKDKFYDLRSVQSYESELINSPSVQIADVLNLISKGLLSNKPEVKESMEEALVFEDVNEQTGEGDEVTQKPKVQIRGTLQNKAIHNYINKVYKYYNNELNSLFKGKVFSSSPDRSIKLRDISNISIVTDLLYNFHGKNYETNKTEIVFLFKKNRIDLIKSYERVYKLKKLDKTNPDIPDAIFYEVDTSSFKSLKSEILKLEDPFLLEQEEYIRKPYEKSYLKIGSLQVEKSIGVKPYLVNVLGGFLICSNAKAGYKKYDYDSINDKVNNYRFEVFERASFLILNLRWTEKEEVYRNVLLLDLLNLICPKSWIQKSTKEMKEVFYSSYEDSKYKSSYFESNLESYFTQLLPKYVQWKKYYEEEKKKIVKEISSIHPGSIVYNRHIGFSMIKQIGQNYLLLMKSGFRWNDFEKGYVLKINTPQKKIIVF